MKTRVWVLRLVFVALLVAVFAVGTLAYAAKPDKPCDRDPNVQCLDIYDPVICHDGVIYGNACYAWKACAKGCKPYDDGIPTEPL